MSSNLNQAGIDLLEELSEATGFTGEMEGGSSGESEGNEGEGRAAGERAEPSPVRRTAGFFPDEEENEYRQGPAPMDEECEGEFCFPSTYGQASIQGVSGMGRVDHTDAIKFIDSSIAKLHGEGARLRDIVDFVFDFYENEVRTAYPSLPTWTKTSIRKYIFVWAPQDQAEDRQLIESINSVYSCIEALRGAVCVTESGRTMPDMKVIKQLGELAKVHSGLVSQRKARNQT
jgi:hypothetical protein